MRRKQPSGETLVLLRRRLEELPPRSEERQHLIEDCAHLHGVSTDTIYRALRDQFRPRALRRRDQGKPRKVARDDMERYCEIIAALKVRTTNAKGRHLSTNRALEILADYGVETPQGLVRPPANMLTKTTVNRYLRAWGYDDARLRQPLVAVRFQAEHSNDCWQFDASPSDLKHVPAPLWIEEGRGPPTLMLFSAVDDRSGATYQEYRCVYGEDAAAGLRFLFNAMAPKEEAGLVLQGVPKMIYADSGPISKSRVYRDVMGQLGVDARVHMPKDSDGRRVTARSKGKVERPFRTVKEAHETLYHFHKPENEAEANLWLRRYLVQYNDQRHRAETHSRSEDWIKNLPAEGFRTMCSWERFCAFAREPERRKVGVDARVQTAGVLYEVDPDLAGEMVTLWWGLFDQELFVEHDGTRFGPYGPIGGPIPLHRYRSFKKTKTEERIGRIEALAATLGLPRAALSGTVELTPLGPAAAAPSVPFKDPDPFQEFRFPTVLAAKLAIADYLATPLARLSQEDRAYIDSILTGTLERRAIIECVRGYFRRRRRESTNGADHAD
ncbi:transposase [Methylocella tundrae]|uniref:Transposase n=1 Tax=Methylocella tundrae TaxID=227605 RepID=A0A8B6M9Y4_METTU|nr:IS481 family transposase [Methylocella tundrae]VTZ26373.1 transposase [Methylocella tundrae]VTZ51692.1 transposase [Methylocella tundrae]